MIMTNNRSSVLKVVILKIRIEGAVKNFFAAPFRYLTIYVILQYNFYNDSAMKNCENITILLEDE